MRLQEAFAPSIKLHQSLCTKLFEATTGLLHALAVGQVGLSLEDLVLPQAQLGLCRLQLIGGGIGFPLGLGGLTAVRSLRQILPEENLIYFGDTARVPYGGRSRETLLKYARQDVRFLRSSDIKAILIACGTVSTTALETLQAENDLPVVGVVEPTCRRALLVTKNKKVGIIATLASIRSGAYEATLKRLDSTVFTSLLISLAISAG